MKILLNSYFLIGFSALSSICSCIFNQPFLFDLSTLSSGITGIILLLRVFLWIETEFSFANLLASILLISAGLGTFNTYNSFESIDTWEIFLAGRGIYSTEAIANAHLFVVLFCLSLILLEGFFYRTHILRVRKLLYQTIAIAQNERLMKTIVILSFLFSSLQIFLLASGQIGFLGSGLTNITDVGKQVRPEIQLTLSIVPLICLVLGINLWRIALNRSRSLSEIGFYCFIGVTQITWFISLGLRREIGYHILLFCLGLRIAFPKINGFMDRKQVWKAIYVLLSIFIGGYIAIQVTTFSRILANSSSYTTTLGFSERITFLAENYINYNLGGDSVLKQGVFEQKSSSNFETRTFVLSSLAMIIDHVDKQRPLMGTDLINSLIKSIPGALLFEKYSFPIQLELYHQELGVSTNFKDIAESIYVSSYVDFSWLGMFIYPIIILHMFNFVTFFLEKINFKLFKLLAINNLAYLCFSSGETSPVSFFVTVRNLLIFFVLLFVFRFFTKK